MDKHDLAKKISQHSQARVRKWVSRDQFELDTGILYKISPSEDAKNPGGWQVSATQPDGSTGRTLILNQQGEIKS